jgi:acyl carrier protein
MDRAEIRTILAELVEETVGEPREVAADQDLREGLGLDSVDLFSLIIEVQTRFRVKIGSEELEPIRRVDDLVALIASKLASKAVPAADAA